jgi:hypothetical protein
MLPISRQSASLASMANRSSLAGADPDPDSSQEKLGQARETMLCRPCPTGLIETTGTAKSRDLEVFYVNALQHY